MSDSTQPIQLTKEHGKENNIYLDKKERIKVFAMLSLGTLLEYADFALYIHMSIIINKVFFPAKYSNIWILSNITICSTYLFKPLGTFIIGRIGDICGRKFTIYITTTGTAIACLATVILPSYEKIGITSAYLLTLFRIIQGITSTGELQGAKLYMTENIQDTKTQCAFAGLLTSFASLGKVLAISLATVALYLNKLYPEGWRIAFVIGALVGMIGSYARTCLRESTEYANAKKHLPQNITTSKHPSFTKKAQKKTILYYFIIKICNSLTVTFIPFFYFKDLMIKSGIKPIAIAIQNQAIGSILFIQGLIWVVMIYKIEAIKITLFRNYICSILILIFPFYLHFFPINKCIIFFFQATIISFNIGDFPASPIFYRRFPIFQRATTILLSVSLAHAIASFLWISIIQILIKYFGHFAWTIFLLPLSIISVYGTHHFKSLHDNYNLIQTAK